MAKYRKVDPRIWNDAKFRSMSDNGKLVFFMLLTHPNMTALGAMRASQAGLAEELGWTPKAFREAFAEGCSKGMIRHDGKACLMALPNFLRYNPPESPNVVKAWTGALDLLPECALKSEVIQCTRAFAKGMSKAFAEALPEAFAKSMPYQEQEQEQEQELVKQVADGSATGAPETKRFVAAQMDLPTSVDRDNWIRWCRYRSKRKKPISADSAEEQIRTLQTLSIADQQASVSASINGGWTGLFPRSANHGNGTQKLTPAEQQRAELERAEREFAERLGQPGGI